MERLRLTLSCNEYDRTRFLVDGTVQAEGIDLEILSLPSEERHRRFSRDLEFDVCELQMGVFLGWIGRGAPFSAIPVFPHRKFCHGNVLIHAASGIQRPEDFAGKIIGMRAHFNPVSLWMRGVLQEDYGVTARSLRIRTNQQEQVPGWEPPDWMEIERLPKGQKSKTCSRSVRSTPACCRRFLLTTHIISPGCAACGRIFARLKRNIIGAPRYFRSATSSW
jgi:4,5-dihydroxyphthalate decarboxylase